MHGEKITVSLVLEPRPSYVLSKGAFGAVFYRSSLEMSAARNCCPPWLDEGTNVEAAARKSTVIQIRRNVTAIGTKRTETARAM
jgi:hypothetical protein